MIGRTISHYQVLELLGEGGMGFVYRARDTRLDRTVAIKFMHPDAASNRERRERFVREAKAASAPLTSWLMARRSQHRGWRFTPLRNSISSTRCPKY